MTAYQPNVNKPELQLKKNTSMDPDKKGESYWLWLILINFQRYKEKERGLRIWQDYAGTWPTVSPDK